MSYSVLYGEFKKIMTIFSLNKQKFFYVIYKIAQKKFEGSGILHKVPFLKRLKNYIINQTKVDFAEVLGHKMFLHSRGISLLLAHEGIYEKVETNLVKNEIKNGQVVLDIGANIGYYTLIFAKEVGNEGHVFAFEPESNNFNLLKKNVEINGYKNVTFEKIAVSNMNGKTKLYISEGPGRHRIYPSVTCTKNYVSVNMMKLDDYFQSNYLSDKISFIKIDVEGSELQVLEGMTILLTKNKKLKILLEFSPYNIKDSKNEPRELLNFLTQRGFKIYFINQQKGKIEFVEDIDYLLELFKKNILNEDFSPNLFCKKE